MPEKNQSPEPVPFAVYEAALGLARGVNIRLFAALLLAIVLLFMSNAAWLYAWTQYDYASDTITVESTAGHANFIGASGDIYNGTDTSQNALQNP